MRRANRGIAMLVIPTEPIGSIPRPKVSCGAIFCYGKNQITREELAAFEQAAVVNTLRGDFYGSTMSQAFRISG
jgi:hypothetical protein